MNPTPLIPDWKRPFEEKSIDIRTVFGDTRKVNALCVGCWAVYPLMTVDGRILSHFIISNCPTGSALPAYFRDQESACRAAVAVHRLRNDWPIVTMQECEQNPDIREKIKLIVLEHDGTIIHQRDISARNLKHVPNNLNGYDDSEVSGRG